MKSLLLTSAFLLVALAMDSPDHVDVPVSTFCTGKLSSDGAPLCSKIVTEDQQVFDADKNAAEIGIRSKEMLTYFGIADDNYINDSVC